MNEEETLRVINSLKTILTYLIEDVKPNMDGNQIEEFYETQDYIKGLINSFRVRLAEGRGE